jgi:ABC-type branched-subunit amino acid transport system substrate-binding protein
MKLLGMMAGLALVFWLSGNPMAAAAEKVHLVKIGNSHGMTGAVSVAHTAYMESMISYFKDLNEKGGIEFKNPKTKKMEKAKIDHIWADDGYVVAKIVANYTRMKGEGIVFFINGSVGGSLAVLELSKRDKIAQLHAGNIKALMYPKHKWMITPSAAYTDSFGAGIDWIAGEWASKNLPPGGKVKLGIITSDTAFGKALREPSTEAYMKENGVEFLGMLFAGVGDIDMTPQVKTMVDKGANWIACNHTAPFASNLAKSIGRLGLQGKVHLFLNQACFDDVFVQQAGEYAEGTVGIGFTGHILDPHPFNDKMREIIKRYYPNTNIFYQHGLGMVYARCVEAGITTALNRFGFPLTGENVADAFFSADGKGVWKSPGGLIPGDFDVASNPQDAVMLHDAALLVAEKGKLKVVKYVRCPGLSYK